MSRKEKPTNIKVSGWRRTIVDVDSMKMKMKMKMKNRAIYNENITILLPIIDDYQHCFESSWTNVKQSLG